MFLEDAHHGGIAPGVARPRAKRRWLCLGPQKLHRSIPSSTSRKYQTMHSGGRGGEESASALLVQIADQLVKRELIYMHL
jgi:hypothetical protein